MVTNSNQKKNHEPATYAHVVECLLWLRRHVQDTAAFVYSLSDMTPEEILSQRFEAGAWDGLAVRFSGPLAERNALRFEIAMSESYTGVEREACNVFLVIQ